MSTARTAGGRGWIAATALFLALLATFLGTRYAAVGTLYFNHPHEPSGIDLHLPMQVASVELWEEGLPTWNPWSGCGTPHLANLQSSVLYPLNAVYHLLPPVPASELLAVLRLCAVGLGCMAFGRSIGLGAGGALCLAMAFALGNWEQRYANNELLYGDLLLPWLALTYMRLGRTGRARAGIAAAAVTALHIFAGLPENTFFSVGFASLLFAYSAFLAPGRASWGGPVRKLGVLLAVLVGAAALAGVQVLPFLEYVRHAWSPHLGETVYGLHANPPKAVAAIAYPLLENTPRIQRAGFTPGAITLLLALRGLRRPLAGGLNFLLAGFVLLGVAKILGLEPLHSLGGLPGVRTLAFTLYLNPPLLFSTAVIAALGFDDWWERPGDRAGVWLWVLLAPALVALWVTGRGSHVLQPRPYALLLLALTLAVLAVGWLRARNPDSRPLGPGLVLLALLGGELWLHQAKLPWTTKAYETLFRPIYAGEAEGLVRALEGSERLALSIENHENVGLLLGPKACFNYGDVIGVARFREYESALGDLWRGPGEDAAVSAKMMALASLDHLLLAGPPELALRSNDILEWLNKRGFSRWTGPEEAVFERRGDELVLTLSAPFEGALSRLKPGESNAISLRLRSAGALSAPVRVELRLRGEAGVEPLIRATLTPGAEGWRTARGFFPAGIDRAGLTLKVGEEGQAPGARIEISGLELERFVRLQVGAQVPADTRPLRVFPLEPALPRAYVVHRARVAERAAVADALADPGFVAGEMVVLEEPPPHPLPGQQAGSGGAPSTARIVESRAKRVTVEVDGERGGLLVLNDTFYPGWRARVDGEEQPILAANLMFRAVPVAAGRHVVEFSYEPWSVRIGSLLSLLTSLGLVALFARRPGR